MAKPSKPRATYNGRETNRSLSDQAYEGLEEMIVTLHLEPGAVLSEAELSEQLGIGRTPIREALQRLGFPAFTGGVIRTSRDYRINNVWDFRRVRMIRAGRDEEKVSQVEVWRWLPRERQ